MMRFRLVGVISCSLVLCDMRVVRCMAYCGVMLCPVCVV